MAAKFTPGPWHVHKLIHPYKAREGDNDYPGATISWTEIEADGRRHPHTDAVEIWSERAEANARLIAAAPELYGLLAEIRQRCAVDNEEFGQHIDALLDRIDGR